MRAVRRHGRQGGHREPSTRHGRMPWIMKPGRPSRQCFVLPVRMGPSRRRIATVAGALHKKEKGSVAAHLCLLLFDAQSTLLQCSTVIGVTVLRALLGRFLPKLRAAFLRPFFLMGEVIHAPRFRQAEFCGFYVRQKYRLARNVRKRLPPRGRDPSRRASWSSFLLTLREFSTGALDSSKSAFHFRGRCSRDGL